MYAEVVAATSAGIVTTVVGHPLDTIKVHLQTNPSLKSTWQATTSLLHNKALFRGILPPLINAIVMNTVMFSVFAGIKKGIGDDSLSSALVAGLASGFVTAFISTPTDAIKIQSQLTGLSTRTVLKSASPTRLFRGHGINLAREGVFTMVYLGLFDQFRPRDSLLSLWEVAVASSLTGGLAWIVSYPFDTIKTVVQSSASSINYQQAMKQIGGHYYRGCGASTGRAVMVTSLRMIVYESMMATS